MALAVRSVRSRCQRAWTLAQKCLAALEHHVAVAGATAHGIPTAARTRCFLGTGATHLSANRPATGPAPLTPLRCPGFTREAHVPVTPMLDTAAFT
jgi:hypothetical protein